MALVYGFTDLETQATMRIAQLGVTETNERIAEWNRATNEAFNALMGAFTTRNEVWNTSPITRYQLPSHGLAQFVDEFAVAKPRIEKGYTEIGLPLMRYEDAIGMSYEAQKRATVAELSRQLERVGRTDMATSMHMLLFAAFYNSNWTQISAEENLPNIPVKALANNDADTYFVRGLDTPQTANHYTAQANAIADADDPFPVFYETLTKYLGTSATDRIVCFVGDSTNVANIQALTAFNPVSRTHYTRWGDEVSLVDPNADTFIGLGDEVLGEHESGVLVVRWRRLPTNYLLVVNIDADGKFGIREDQVAELRGLFNIDSIENSGNMLLQRFRRKIGFAAVNRTCALVHQVGAASYTTPSPFTVIPG